MKVFPAGFEEDRYIVPRSFHLSQSLIGLRFVEIPWTGLHVPRFSYPIRRALGMSPRLSADVKISRPPGFLEPLHQGPVQKTFRNHFPLFDVELWMFLGN